MLEHKVDIEWEISSDFHQKISLPLIGILKAAALLNELEQYSAYSYPTDTPRRWIKLFKKIAKGYLDYLKFLEKQINSHPTKDIVTKARLSTARAMIIGLGELRSFLRFIATAETSGTVYELIAPFEELMKRFERKTSIIMRPQWKYNFTYRDFSNDYLLPLFLRIPTNDEKDFISLAKGCKLESENDKIPRMAVISFAGIERNNVLNQVVLAHEIGHLLDDAYEVYKSTDLENIIKSESKRLSTEIKEIFGRGKETEQLLELIEEIQDAEDWVKELIADIIAVRLLGPAYLFALHSVLFSLSTYEEVPHKHPSLRVRLKWTLEECNKIKYVEFFKRLANEEESAKIIYKYFKRLQKVHTKGSQDIKTKILRKITDKAIGVARNFIRKDIITNENCFQLNKEIFYQVQCLAREFPPNQRYIPKLMEKHPKGEPYFDMRSILNAGWIFYLTHKKSNVSTLEKLEREAIYDPEDLQLRIISDLILLAIKSSTFQKNYLTKLKGIK